MSQPPPIQPPSAKKDRSNVWGLAVANQFALPGLGTVMAGRKIGYLQLLFSVSGVMLTTAFLIWALPNFGDWLPPPQDPDIIISNFEKWKWWLVVAGGGIVLFATGWCMALISSQSIVKQRSKQPEKR